MLSSSLLFPGQGSQETGMGRDLAENDHETMELWKKAERVSGIALREIYWGGAGADMAETRNLQPGLTVANLALWRALAGKMTPTATAGHSLGEFSALAAAQVLPLETIFELVALRGRLMSQADPSGTGTMAAVLKLSLEQVRDCVDAAAAETGELVLVANHNTPGQFVVSGTRNAVANIQGKVREAKGRAVPLAVSGAFHSPLMRDAAEEFAAAVRSVPQQAWSKARFPVYSNAAPAARTDPDALRDQLTRQMTSPVFWIDTIAGMWDGGCRAFVECGPKGVLGKMVGPILEKRVPAATGTEESSPWRIVQVGTAQQLAEFSL